MVDSADILNASILIVDDQTVNVLLLERMLHGAGYLSLTSTTDPGKVVEMYGKNRYDLILLDIKMPGKDGFEVMAGLKEIETFDYLPVLVITAEPGHKERALQAGAKDFVSKPFELCEVLTRVHNMLEARLLLKETLEHKEDNPALSNVIHRNIRKIIQLRMETVSQQGLQDRIASAITTFSGSMIFFYAHIVWFSAWIITNTGSVGMIPFDPFPYGLLTMFVSLEAIFLSTFVLIRQNLLSKEADHLAGLGLQTSLLTEHELTRVLQMLHAVQNKLGIKNDEDSNLADADLEMETKPEDVLAEIKRLQQRARSNPHRGRK
ncbi:MAG: response regulator [Dehalococcoidia bacterium]|nr:response regulator [Dehalococcoidia bacterium]